MIKTPNVYSNFIKDNVKNKLSYTENFNAYAKENLGVDLDSESANFYGADTLLSAKDIYSGYVQDFQQNIGTAKADMSQGITNTANVYKDAIVNYDTQLKQNQNAYGQRKENLASGGMLGGGWEKYLDDNVYAQYVEAVNILNNQSADVYKEYSNAYATTEKRADRTLGKQAETLATNVYGKIQGDYSAYKDAYNEDIKDVVKAYSNVEKPTSVEGLNAYADYLDKETYDNLLENVQSKNFEVYKQALDKDEMTYETFDAEKEKGNISKEQHSQAYLEKFLADKITTQGEYDEALKEVKNSTKLLGELMADSTYSGDKGKALAELNAIDREKLPATEKEAAIIEKVKAIDEVAPESNKQTLGLQPGQLEAGDNYFGDAIEEALVNLYDKLKKAGEDTGKFFKNIGERLKNPKR